DLQWMNCEAGVRASQMLVKTQPCAHGLRLWINLPLEHKISEPQYYELLDA
ncbi:MAG: hypothetical protein JOS17DRAFT_681667, partial [Linnemannia elongata]